MPEPVCVRCAHAPGLFARLEEAPPPLPFAMFFSAAEKRTGGILALPNGFLKTLVAQRYGDELARFAESVGFEHVEIVVDPTVSLPPLTSPLPPSDFLEHYSWVPGLRRISESDSKDAGINRAGPGELYVVWGNR